MEMRTDFKNVDFQIQKPLYKPIKREDIQFLVNPISIV
jgi:hypothetical protein